MCRRAVAHASVGPTFLLSTNSRPTIAFLQHVIHTNTPAARFRPSIKVACFSCLPSTTSSFVTSSRRLSNLTAPMPETRSQAQNRASLFHPRNSSQSTASFAASFSAEPDDTNSPSQRPHDSQDNSFRTSVVADQGPEISTFNSKHTNTPRPARKRKGQVGLDKHTPATFQKRPRIPDHRKCNDIEDAPCLPSSDSAKQVLHLLKSFYRRPLSTATHPKTKPRKALLDSLIATILSQATSNTNSSRAFEKLKTRFANWDSALEAGPGEIEAYIACGGLAHAKSKVIHDILSKLKKEHQLCSLEFIRDMPTEDVKNVLCSFKGVGPKTASCVLMFAMDRPEFPVDTHVRRIAGRLGWMPLSSTPEKTYERLNSCLPDDTKYDLHVLLVEHGRKTCKASTPLCDKCPLLEVCRFAEQQ